MFRGVLLKLREGDDDSMTAVWFDVDLDEYRKLKPGWDSYRARVPNDYSIDAAKDVLRVLKAHDIEPTHVAASVIGGVGITIRQSKKRLVFIESQNHGRTYIVLGNGEDCDVAPITIAEPDGWINRIREHLK